MSWQASIAYFSMEIALDPELPTYAGGLGILAGDMLHSAADDGLPLVAVTLVHRHGYFRQSIGPDGEQIEEPAAWDPATRLVEMRPRAQVEIEERRVWLRAWRYSVEGAGGSTIPVFLLDTDLPENSPADRAITNDLYGGDASYRLCQEIVLGIGGVRMLRELGFTALRRFHMNEGHSSLLTLELLRERMALRGGGSVGDEDVRAVREICVFTTHTPVAAAVDQYPVDLVQRALCAHGCAPVAPTFALDGVLNLTHLALSLSHYVNGVGKRHGEVSRHSYPLQAIDSITNGVRAATWASPPFQALFDRFIPDWRRDSQGLRRALAIPRDAVQQAHAGAKRALVERLAGQLGAKLELERPILGLARRMTQYKRVDLLFRDLGRLEKIAADCGGLQVVVGGKAHPRDLGGKEMVRRLAQIARAASGALRVVFVPDYGWEWARFLVSGSDLWINTPEPPLEASGTSGMKAAVNGVPSFSILDGWWAEGWIEGVTGWAIERHPGHADDARDAALASESLYEKLELIILPVLAEPARFAEIMRNAIALNASYFNSERMLDQYVVRAYFR
ncbi:MAG TPA: alpha-glucan family phosphorylase [Myxococcota bacterium]|nr:alpha-glucan family phosphorylase [Myxococcota bacterium]